jgi:hypothetical protein
MDVWLEKQWRHATNPNQTDIQHGYQLCVSVSEESLKNYRLTWRIGDHRNRYFGRGYHSLIYARFDHMPREEEEFLVQEGFDLNPDRENKVVLGKFVVRKKQKKE